MQGVRGLVWARPGWGGSVGSSVAPLVGVAEPWRRQVEQAAGAFLGPHDDCGEAVEVLRERAYQAECVRAHRTRELPELHVATCEAVHRGRRWVGV